MRGGGGNEGAEEVGQVVCVSTGVAVPPFVNHRLK